MPLLRLSDASCDEVFFVRRPKRASQRIWYEQIAEEAAALFPKATVKRMDLDTTRGKHAFGDLIRSVEQGEVDILVGTQMVTKGLDFDRVGLVGIMSADNLLSYPDFRANERAFQLIEQVSGRTGRRTSKGKVVIQSMKPRHAIIQMAMNHDYDGMLQKSSWYGMNIAIHLTCA